jgi:hypothetical protein
VVITPSLYAQACAVRRVKSTKLIGGLPVTLWTSLLGREPCYGPDAIKRLEILDVAKRAGFTRDEVRGLLQRSDAGSPAFESLRELAAPASRQSSSCARRPFAPSC